MWNVPSPYRKITPDEEAERDDLREAFGQQYEIDWDGYFWKASSLVDGTIIRADSAGVLRKQIENHQKLSTQAVKS